MGLEPIASGLTGHCSNHWARQYFYLGGNRIELPISGNESDMLPLHQPPIPTIGLEPILFSKINFKSIASTIPPSGLLFIINI